MEKRNDPLAVLFTNLSRSDEYNSPLSKREAFKTFNGTLFHNAFNEITQNTNATLQNNTKLDEEVKRLIIKLTHLHELSLDTHNIKHVTKDTFEDDSNRKLIQKTLHQLIDNLDSLKDKREAYNLSLENYTQYGCTGAHFSFVNDLKIKRALAHNDPNLEPIDIALHLAENRIAVHPREQGIENEIEEMFKKAYTSLSAQDRNKVWYAAYSNPERTVKIENLNKYFPPTQQTEEKPSDFD